jgi:hypothetical protein
MSSIEVEMGLPYLYAAPTDAASWRRWSFNHAANHFDMLNAAQLLQQAEATLVTNAVTLVGHNTLQFAAVNGVKNGMNISDVTTGTAIPVGTVVQAFNTTQVQMSENAAVQVNNGDTILFSPGAVIQLAQYILDPMDLNNLGFWAYQHQSSHNQLNAVLGTEGYDLLSYDFQDPDELKEFLRLNGDEHQRLSAALGVG